MTSPVLFDARWAGPHGIGRFAGEVRTRLEGPVHDLHGAHPVSPRGLVESEVLPRLHHRRDRDTTYFTPGYTPCLSWPGRHVFTIHDLIHLDVAQESSRLKTAYYEQVVRRAARGPGQVLTVSQFSRHRIAEWAGVDPDRITVVGNGVDPRFSPQGPRRTTPWPYLLHVGNTRPHKNLARVVQALALVPDIHLVCSSAPDPALVEQARRWRCAHRLHFLSGIDEQELPGWYRGAEAVVIASTYEGFGLPALEGLASGVVVVASNSTSLPEVVGEAAVLIEPTDVDSLRLGIERALGDAQLRADLAVRGPEQAQQHTWQAVAERVNRALGTTRPAPQGQRHQPGPAPVSEPRVALAHDYFTQRGGAERVAVELTRVFGHSDMWTALYEPGRTYPELAGVRVHTSPLNRFAALRHNFKLGLPLFGWAFSQGAAATDAEVMVVSTTAFAHGIRTPARKVVYCHSPARFIYLIDEYLGRPWFRTPLGWALIGLRPALRRWDQRAAASAAVYLCNSTTVQHRIERVYGRQALVVHPPAGLTAEGEQAEVPQLQGWQHHHLLVSRLRPYKNVDVAIAAFAELPDQHLLVVGSGPQRAQLAAGLPPNVRLAEGLSDAQLRRAYAGASSVIAPSFEDFGLTPVEGFAFGVPTLALRAGGYLDTVVEGRTGYFFDAPEPARIAAAVRRLGVEPLERADILAHAQRFTPQAFARALREVVDDVVAAGRAERCG